MSDTPTADAVEAYVLEMRAEELLNAFLDEFPALQEDPANKTRWWTIKPAEAASGQRILRQDRRTLAVIVRQATVLAHDLIAANAKRQQRLLELYHQRVRINPLAEEAKRDQRRSGAANSLISALCRRTLPFTAEDILIILDALTQTETTYILYGAMPPLLKAMRPALADAAVMARCRPALEQRRAAVAKTYGSAPQRDLLRTLDELLDGKEQTQTAVIHPDEWGDQVNPWLAALAPEARERWVALLRQCATARGSAPSEKWLRAGREAREPLGAEAFAAGAVALLEAFRASSNKPPAYEGLNHQFLNNGSILDERNADLLRGLIWLCADVEDARLAAALGDGVIAGYRKITGHGPRCAKVAGACVFALQRAPHLSGAAQLERARHNVKQPQYLKGIERALDGAAEAAGIAREELEELTVPTFELADGRRRGALGAATAELAVEGDDVALRWFDADGKPRKAEPAEVRRDHKAELKELKRLRDDLAHMLAAQSARLERLPLAERRWPLAVWRARYLDHPLVGPLARRLIWRFALPAGEQVDGAWLAGALVGPDDQPLALPDDATVTTWHPVFATAAETLAWRAWLERHSITQPFKQGRREVYLLTDAERATRVYSNRFAGHILRQHQFNALCAARGWRNTLRLMVDDEYPPATLDLPRWNLRVEFWIEGAGDEYEVDTNATGTYWRVSTDQVRFYRPDAPTNYAHAGGGSYTNEDTWRARRGEAVTPHPPVPLEEIPPLVLSEVMRDVDLFVGVASVGADPTWQDGGPNGRYRDYWQAYSFGELSTSGEQRRQLLERLLPRLNIASRCALDGRFLRVRGDLREYKIHLGSGNILMEPNDQYLCIVQSRGLGSGSGGDVYLPFEGDNTLAVILSKAFLLAADTKITDPTITRQIGA